MTERHIDRVDVDALYADFDGDATVADVYAKAPCPAPSKPTSFVGPALVPADSLPHAATELATPFPKAEAMPTATPIEPHDAVAEAKNAWRRDNPPPAKRRALPRKALLLAGGAACLLLLPLLTRGGHGRDGKGEKTSSDIPSELMISSDDLKNRREASAFDFRPRHQVAPGRTPAAAATGAAPAPPPLEAAGSDDAELSQRRARRADDPEDLIAHRGPRKAAADDAERSAPSVAEDRFRRPFVYLPVSGGPAVGAAGQGKNGKSAIAPAGTVVPAVLQSAVELHGGAATVIAHVVEDGGALPKGTRFVGSAVASEARVLLRFNRMILPDGRDATCQGEAQDASGQFGLVGEVEGGFESRSVAGDVAAGTAQDAASAVVDTFTGGLAGGLIRRAGNRASSAAAANRMVSTVRVSLAAGTRFQVFFGEPVVLRD